MPLADGLKRFCRSRCFLPEKVLVCCNQVILILLLDKIEVKLFKCPTVRHFPWPLGYFWAFLCTPANFSAFLLFTRCIPWDWWEQLSSVTKTHCSKTASPAHEILSTQPWALRLKMSHFYDAKPLLFLSNLPRSCLWPPKRFGTLTWSQQSAERSKKKSCKKGWKAQPHLKTNNKLWDFDLKHFWIILLARRGNRTP